MRKTIVFLVVNLLLVMSLHAESRYSLSGKILNTEGEALEGVVIFLHEIHAQEISDSRGNYHFSDLSSGSYHLHISHIGYKAAKVEFNITNQDLHLETTLEKTNIALHEVLIELDKTHQAKQSESKTIAIIDKQQLLEYQKQSLVLGLEQIPGIRAASIGSGMAKPVIRGLTNNRVVVAQNGIKQEGQQWGSDHGLEIDQYAIEKVEVIKGPDALMYGSDAIGGVINTISEGYPSPGHSVDILINTASVNQLIGSSIRYAWAGKKCYAGIRFSQNTFGDFKVPTNEFEYNGYVLPLVNGQLNNTAGKEQNFSFHTGYHHNQYNTYLIYSLYTLNAGFFAGAIGIPRFYDVLPESSTRDVALPQQNVKHHRIEWHQKLLFKKNWLNLSLATQLNDRLELSLPHSHGIGMSPQDSIANSLKLQTHYADLRYHQVLGTNFKAIYGITSSLQENTIGGFEFIIPAYTKWEKAAYMVVKQDVNENLKLQYGLRLDQTEMQTEAYEVQYFNTQGELLFSDPRADAFLRNFNSLSGSVGMSWQKNEKNNIKFHLGSGFKSPSIADLASNGIHHGTFRHEKGAANLKPERSWQLDLAYHHLEKKWELAISPFVNLIQDFIYLSPTSKFSTLPEAGQLYQYQQVDALLTGFEAHWHAQFSPTWQMDVMGDYVFAQNLESFLPLPFIPSGRIQTKLEKKYIKTKATFLTGASAQYYLPQNRIDRNESATPSSFIVNIYTSVKWKVRNQNLHLTLAVQNLFNKPYWNHISQYRRINIPELGRNLTFTLRLPLQNLGSKKS